MPQRVGTGIRTPLSMERALNRTTVLATVPSN
jgi:hypothetical protein